MKTAIEWFVEQMSTDLKMQLGYELIEQAKELDKQQKIDAWNDGNFNTDLKGNPSANYAITAEHYYNQKYGNETTQKLE